jgi:hypothetical protein
MVATSEEKTITRRPRRNHSPPLKAKMAVAAIKGEDTLIELAQDIDAQLSPDRACLNARDGQLIKLMVRLTS